MNRMTIVTDNASAEDCRKGLLVSKIIKDGCDFTFKDAANLGITGDMASWKRLLDSDPEYRKAVEGIVSDAGLSLGEANIDALGQFFLVYVEQTINALYRGRTAIQTFGVKTMGDWTTERIAFKLRELTAKPSIYDDFTRAQYASYNYGWDTRDTLRMEWALEITKLEEAVGAVMRRNPHKDKMDAITLNHELFNNDFFYNGATVGDKKLYGVFTEPNISSAARKRNLPVDLGSQNITVDEVIATLRLIKQRFADDLQGAAGDIETLPVEIACPLAWQTAFTVPNTVTGYTANKWLKENWSSATISYKPELNTADDGDAMMLVFCKSIPGVGMDTINLIETSKLRLIGAVPTVKGREESYSSSVAGAICACPFGVAVWANGDGSASV